MPRTMGNPRNKLELHTEHEFVILSQRLDEIPDCVNWKMIEAVDKNTAKLTAEIMSFLETGYDILERPWTQEINGHVFMFVALHNIKCSFQEKEDEPISNRR